MSTNAELDFWAGPEGDAYMNRNATSKADVEARAECLRRVLFVGNDDRDQAVHATSSILEVGPGPGQNLRALRSPCCEWCQQLYGVEPNKSARDALEAEFPGRIYDGHAGAICAADNSFDLVFTAGVLIHIHPDRLVDCMREIARVSRRYVLAIEYFAPSCEPIVYYGAERIWRNDFGKLYVEQCGLVPVDTGFFWRPPGQTTGYDSTVYWLLEKKAVP